MSEYEWVKTAYKYTNWRFIAQNKTIDHSVIINTLPRYKKGLWILLDNYSRSCFIYGMTIKEFLEISKCGNYPDGTDHCWHSPRITYCRNCNGAGKFDWISRVTGPPSFDKVKYKYVRDENKFLTFQHTDFFKDYIFAPTKIFGGERICKECMGTGIQINSDKIKNLLLHSMDKLQKGEN